MKDAALLRIFSAVHLAGLTKFLPDVLGAPDSMYNQVHQMVAVQTFMATAAGFGYAHMNIDLSKAQNIDLIDQFYENFVFSYLADLLRAEMKKPGALNKSISDGNIYRRRIGVRAVNVVVIPQLTILL
jgi:hypothetical protein